eukprot:scaffold1551_cov206-Alexandrium_tamarense.AAC.2
MKKAHHSPPTEARPSLTRTSYSASTTSPRQHTDESNEWEQSDIRGDMAAGWGSSNDNNGGRGSGVAGAVSAAAGVPLGVVPDDNDWGWKLQAQAVHKLPAFYPLDQRSTRRLLLGNEQQHQTEGGETVAAAAAQAPTKQELHSIGDISRRISSACQHMSIQAQWDNSIACATLFTMERVEMVISMYLEGDAGGLMGGTPSGSKVLLIELQRRKGCNLTFHHYRRALLDAAEGKFNAESFHKKDGLEKPGGRDRCNQPRASILSTHRPALSRPSGLRPPSFSANDADAMFAGLKTEGESFDADDVHPLHKKGASDVAAHADIVDKALVALNIAASLIKKDRVDARRLGMESLVLLTDPLRAGMETAKIASRVVLLGTAKEEMVWKANDMDVGFGDDDVDALFDESAGLGIRETILEMIMGDDFGGKSSSDDMHDHDIDKEFTDSLFNLCLAVLNNALHTLGEKSESMPTTEPNRVEQDDNDDEDGRKPSPANRRRAATEPAVRPSLERNVSKRFIDDTTSTFGCDVLSSLIRILGQAKSNPHDAYHSAKCLEVLFKGCGNSHKARARRDLDAKQIISAALEVGARSHAKLADASRGALVALVTDDENSFDEGEEKTELEYQQEDEGEESNQEMESAEEHPPSPSFSSSPSGKHRSP